MKVLQVCARYHPEVGGIQEHVRRMSERLARRYDVTVATTDPSGRLPREETIENVKVRRFNCWAPNAAYYFSNDLRKFLIRNSADYDVVHAHGYHALPALYAAQAKTRNRLVVTPHYHGTGHTSIRRLLHVPYSFLGAKIFRKADKIVCVSNYELKLICQRFKVDGNKTVLIPNGINPEEFEGLSAVRKDRRLVLFVGRLEKYKGVEYLIKALPKLDEDVRLAIVGEGAYKRFLLKLIANLGVTYRVTLYEKLSREALLEKYAEAGLFVLPSGKEAYGISVVEAMAAGTPSIVANTTALSELIDNKICFGIDYPINIENLANMIKTVIGRTVERQMLPTWDEAAEKLAELYENPVRANWKVEGHARLAFTNSDADSLSMTFEHTDGYGVHIRE